MDYGPESNSDRPPSCTARSQTPHTNHDSGAAEQKTEGSRNQNQNMPQWSRMIEQRKVKTMQPVNQPPMKPPAGIYDGEDLAGSSVELNPGVRAIV